MKPRLFWTILLAFALVIVLAVCGMISFIGLSVAGFVPSGERAMSEESLRVWAAPLSDYYVARGGSWDGVDQRLADMPYGGMFGIPSYILVDAERRVVASSSERLLGATVDAQALARGVPVVAGGAQVGTLLLRSQATVEARVAPGGPDFSHRAARGPKIGSRAAFGLSVARGFLLAGLGLGLALLGLAVFFAQRLSRPLRNLTLAARALASGDLSVQVGRAPVRELDDLSHAFNAMARALSQADRQRRQMTADIAHELRTPLTIIKGRLEGLQDGVYSPTPDQIARLLDETALLERLIEDLRLLALAEAGQLPLYPEPLDPYDLLAGAAASFADQAALQGVALRVEAADGLPQIEADPLRMSQVFANLIANALRHTPGGGAVTLAAERAGGGPPPAADRQPAAVLFRVSDTGQGIDPDDLPHIFDRFYRADRARTRSSGGSGLGLAITRQIVAAHGGEIWAASQPGRGTTISVALPASEVLEPAI